MIRWHVIQIERNKYLSAAMAIADQGFEAFVPTLPRKRFVAGKWREENRPRFGVYIFARFDALVPGWQGLVHGSGQRAGIVRILCNASLQPSPVSDEVIEAIRQIKPDPEPIEIGPYRYKPGELCIVHIGGHRQEATFLEYRGNRQFVRAWVFGAEHTAEVRTADLEPIDAVEDVQQ